MAFNEEHGIEPKTVRKAINDISTFIAEADENVGKRDRSRGDTLGHGAFFTPAGDGANEAPGFEESSGQRLAEVLASLPKDELQRIVATMEEDMRSASEAMDFEEAARLRDAIVHIKAVLEGSSEDEAMEALRRTARKGSVFGGGRKRQGWKGKH